MTTTRPAAPQQSSDGLAVPMPQTVTQMLRARISAGISIAFCDHAYSLQSVVWSVWKTYFKASSKALDTTERHMHSTSTAGMLVHWLILCIPSCLKHSTLSQNCTRIAIPQLAC